MRRSEKFTLERPGDKRARSRPNPADIWALVTYGIIVLGIIAAYSMYTTILSMDRLQLINFELVQTWRETARNMEFVLSNPQEQMASPALYTEMQTKLGELIKRGSQNEQEFRAVLGDSENLRSLFQFGRHLENEQLRALEVHPELVRRANEMHGAPYTVFNTGFAYWPTDVIISIKSDQYLKPLLERTRLLSAQSHRLLQLLYTESIALVLLLSTCLATIWLGFLRPTIRDLTNTQTELQFVLDNAPARICSFTPDGAYISANRNYLEFLGLSRISELHGRMIADVLGVKRWNSILRQLEITQRHPKRKFQVELEITGKPSVLLVSYEVHHAPDGKIEKIVALIIDITKMDQARSARRLSEERLRITLDSIGDAVISTDADGHVVEMNPQAASLTGWSSDDARGQPLEQVFNIVNAKSRAVIPVPIERILRENAVIELANDTLLMSRDDQEYLIASSGAPIRDRNGKTVGVVLVFRDVTEEFRLRNALRQTEKLKALGHLGGGIAHDFNNILAGIQGNLDLIAISGARDGFPSIAGQIDEIERLIRRGAGLTDQLIQFAQMKPTRMEPVDMCQLVSECVEIIRKTSDRRIEFEIISQTDTYHVSGDESVLQAAVMNVMLNAVDAIEGAGLVQIKIKNMVAGQISEVLSDKARAEHYIAIHIRDSGKGIPDQDLPHVFEPFFSTKEPGKGNGLGLPAAYGTLRKHGGAIRITTEPGTGTELILILPTSPYEPPAARVGTEHGDEIQPGASLTILFADDEAALRETAREFLTRANHRVILAENGQDCLEQFQRQRDNIDLVIIDLNMPVMSGADAMTRISEIAPETRFIVTSGYSRESSVALMLASDNIRFMKKPYPFSNLIREIAAFAPKRNDKG